MAGLVLDPWEEFVLAQSLGVRADGKWAAFEVGLEVSRQNGKGAILEARELAGLFLFDERLITHTAHQFDTSIEAFRRLWSLIESTPDLEQRVHRKSDSHGEEGIELTNGHRIRFRTRTKKGGRGFSGDLLVYDEAMDIAESAHGALLPILSARPNPQILYTGSAVDQEVHENGLVFARVRKRGLKGGDPSLAYFEFSADVPAPDDGPATPDHVTDEIASNPEAWAQANPALGIRISPEYIENERRALSPRSFAVERLGVGDWPRTDGGAGRKIGPEDWAALADASSDALDPVCFAFDVTPDRRAAAIGVAGYRSDKLSHVEVVDHRRGTGWVAERVAELRETHRSVGVVCDTTGPAASLLQQFVDLDIEVTEVNAREHAQACGAFFDAVDQDTLRHLDTPELNAAIAGAVSRPLGEAWAWSRKSSNVDISPLVVCTLALWGVRTLTPRPRKPRVIDLNAALAAENGEGTA